MSNQTLDLGGDPVSSTPEEPGLKDIEASAPVGLSVVGILFGISCSVSYTISNACFREAATQVDFVLCAAAKAAITAALIVPWWLVQGLQGKRILPGPKQIAWLIFAGLQLQFLGGTMLQASLSTIGIALVVPIYLGSMVVCTALLSQFVLKEKIGLGVMLALVILVGAVFLLSLGAQTVHQNMEETKQLGTAGFSFVGGILAAVVVGISYALLAVIIRGVFKACEFSKQTPIVFVSLTGLVVLGTWSYFRGGATELMEMSSSVQMSLLGGGVFNALGFFFLTSAICMLPVIFVNAINISQAAMAAIVGLLIFHEPATTGLWVGLGVMLVGFGVLSVAKKDLSKPGCRSLAKS